MNKSKKTFARNIIFLLILFLGLASFIQASPDNFSPRAKVAIREIGNQLLLKLNDSSSLIKPVLEVGECKYQLSFDREIGFEPNILVEQVKKTLLEASISESYLVEMIQCEDGEVAYSFEINGQSETDLIPCRGRELPKACYLIEFTFSGKEEFSKTLIYGLAVLMAFVLILLIKKRMDAKSDLNSEIREKDSSYSSFGSFQFYPDQNKLVKQSSEIGLSRKECELLAILVENLNQVVKRDELSKKVWEDNGVIVGRSLDTYISKLRKKLKDDEKVNLTNIHGVGYKLEIKE